jgi:hypothetical protein
MGCGQSCCRCVLQGPPVLLKLASGSNSKACMQKRESGKGGESGMRYALTTCHGMCSLAQVGMLASAALWGPSVGGTWGLGVFGATAAACPAATVYYKRPSTGPNNRACSVIINAC